MAGDHLVSGLNDCSSWLPRTPISATNILFCLRIAAGRSGIFASSRCTNSMIIMFMLLKISSPTAGPSVSGRTRPICCRRAISAHICSVSGRGRYRLGRKGCRARGIALYEKKTGMLLSGDIVCDGPLIDDVYHSDIEDYVGTMLAMRELDVSVVHGGHFPSFGKVRYRQLIDVAGKRKAGCHLHGGWSDQGSEPKAPFADRGFPWRRHNGKPSAAAAGSSLPIDAPVRRTSARNFPSSGRL